ncbi:hypothetical protein PG991_011867 [Apiospora marii]|uniref:Neprosin domain-containing protein n=1 Tax=Apiospora marii TaxID=335849 RepID=A0ABR1RHH2_9PEZI
MMSFAVAAFLLALLEPFGAGLPMGSSVTESLASIGSTARVSSPVLSLLDNSSSPVVGSATGSPPTKVVVARVPTETPDIGRPEWPFDPDHEDPHARNWKDPENYNCNKMASLHNQIPPNGLTVQSSSFKYDNQHFYTTWVYSAEEIYRAFRDGAMLVWSAANELIDLEDFEFNYNGEEFPRVWQVPQGFYYEEHFIGLGTWFGYRSRDDSTTEIYEWPLVSGGDWPESPETPPGPDRVLFQLIGNIPLYLGVVTTRGVYPNPLPVQRVVSWGVMQQANGRIDQAAVESLHYPGIPTDTEGVPEPDAIRKTANNLKNSYKDGGAWGETYGNGGPPKPSGPANPPHDPGSGAGGASGNYPRYLGAGGVSSGEGGVLGNDGALNNLGQFPQVGCIFRKDQPALIAAPSHVEL